MESIIRNVKDIEPEKRQWLERAIGQQLRDNQQIIIQVINLSDSPGERAESHTEAKQQPAQLPDWCDVYTGMSEKEIEQVENIILDRRGWTQHSQKQ